MPSSDKEVRSFVELRIREMILNGMCYFLHGLVMSMCFTHWIYLEYLGDFENLKGKGKPFNYSDAAVR